METISHEELQALQNENKTLKGKIRGYQTLGHLFQEVKEKNRLLEKELQNKEMMSVSTETGPAGPTDLPGDVIPTENAAFLGRNDITDPKNSQTPSLFSASSLQKERPPPTVDLIGTSMGSSVGQYNETAPNSVSSEKQEPDISLPIENMEKPEETIPILRQKLEDALHLLGEFERKRSNDKKLVKILNAEVKRAKDEIRVFQNKYETLKTEKELLMKKISRLERERDNLPLNTVSPVTVASGVEGAEDWVDVHQETLNGQAEENNYQAEMLRNKCRELEEKAVRWENEHFNLQMESSKHINDLRSLLESKSKELNKVTESLNMEKKMLESKFKKLEGMLQNEKDKVFESYNLHQETVRKYKILEKKFLTLEQKNRNSPMEGIDRTEKSAFHMSPTVLNNESNNDEQNLMLKQQVALFKEDFENEMKARLKAEKESKTFEEKLHALARQLEKKENEYSKYEKALKDEKAKSENYLQLIAKLEGDNKRINDHNLMLMELQTSSRNQQFKPKEALPTPLAQASRQASYVMKPEFWSCKICTYLNDCQAENCNMCKARRPYPRERNSPKFTPRWKCTCCTYENNPKSDICSICKASRPPPDLDVTDHTRRLTSRPHEETFNRYDDDDDLTIDGPPSNYCPEDKTV